jgi:anti-sigma regulatory factor (Ser/Thr protein kinase)
MNLQKTSSPPPESGTRSLVLQNSLDELTKLEQWLKKAANQLGISERSAFRLDLVLAETVTNIIQYAYEDQIVRFITITLQDQPGQIKVRIEDDGQPFDPRQNPDVVLPRHLEEAGEGGLGIHLIRQFTDQWEYQRQDGKNILTLLIRDQ